eukprot:912303-Karenia_brevis.AAC.1
MVENVASMSSEARAEMSAALGAEPIFVDARDVSHCHRPRLYWLISPLTWEWQCTTSLHGESVTRLHLPGGCGPVSRWIKKGATWDGESLPTFVRHIPRSKPPFMPAGID